MKIVIKNKLEIEIKNLFLVYLYIISLIDKGEVIEMFSVRIIGDDLLDNTIKGELEDLSDKKLRKTIIRAFNACNNRRLYPFIQRDDTLTYRNMKTFIYGIKEWADRDSSSNLDNWITDKVSTLLNIHTDRSLITLWFINQALKNPSLWPCGVPFKRVIKNSEIKTRIDTHEMMTELENYNNKSGRKKKK